MSWSDNLLDCSYRGQPILVMSESTGAEYSLVPHGVPYQNGESVEPLGRNARRFSIKAVNWGSNYEVALQALLAIFEQQSGELVHPIYGSINVVIASWNVGHVAERPDYAALDLVFVENTPGAPFFERALFENFTDLGLASDLDLDSSTTWQSALLDTLARVDSLVSEVQQWIGGGWTGLMEKALGLPGITLRLQQLRSQALGVISGVAGMAGSTSTAFDPLIDLVRTPTEIRAAIDTSTPSKASELLAGRGVPSAMPGDTTLDANALRTANALLASAFAGTEPDAGSLPEAMPSDPVAASAYGLVIIFITELALAHAEAVTVILEDESVTQTLSPEDLSRLVALVRSLIQSAILLHRNLYGIEQALAVIEPLRMLAGLIQARARQVILQRPPMINRAVESAASLRLLAFRWYGDHARAAELLRLNPRLRSPFMISSGEVLRAYAS